MIYLKPQSQQGEKDIHPGSSHPKPDQATGSQTSVLNRITQGVWKMLMPRSRPRDPDLTGLGGVWALRLSNVPQECPTAAELESPRDTRPLTHTPRPTLMSGCGGAGEELLQEIMRSLNGFLGTSPYFVSRSLRIGFKWASFPPEC